MELEGSSDFTSKDLEFSEDRKKRPTKSSAGNAKDAAMDVELNYSLLAGTDLTDNERATIRAEREEQATENKPQRPKRSGAHP